jgi:S1-C subfamily serine protease
VKRLLAYLFIFLGLGLTFSVSANAANKDSIILICPQSNGNFFVQKTTEKKLQTSKYNYERKWCIYKIHQFHDSELFNKVWVFIKHQNVGKLYKNQFTKFKNQYDFNNIWSSKNKNSQIAKAEPSQTQKVAGKKVDLIFCDTLGVGQWKYKVYYKGYVNRDTCNQWGYDYKSLNYNDFRFLTKNQKMCVRQGLNGPILTKKNCDYFNLPEIKLDSGKFYYNSKIKTQIAKAEPSQTQPESDSDIKFCVFIPNFSNTKHSEKRNWETNGYKYRVIRLDNPYLKCVNVQFIIDKNYHDQLFYEYLLDTMELVDKQDFVTLRPVDHWRNKAEPSQTQIADNDAKELENERKKIAEEKRKIEEEKRKIAEAKNKQEEEDQKRKEANAKLYVIGSGTGFFVSSEGHVVSNDHVVGICRKVATKIEGKIINFNVINTDKVNDLGLIQGEYKSKNFLNIKSGGAEFGEDIVAFGYPLSDALSTSVKLTRGIVSSLSGPGNNYSEIQIDAAIQPGNSGGPVLNMEGQVVGVASSGLNKLYMLESSEYIPENVNFAVASTTLSNFLKANGVSVSNASLRISNTKELAKIGRPATLQLFCMNTKAVHEELKKTKKHNDVLLEKVIELR